MHILKNEKINKTRICVWISLLEEDSLGDSRVIVPDTAVESSPA